MMAGALRPGAPILTERMMPPPAPVHFDLVHAGDPRYRGGTASALRGEIALAHGWGLRAALLPFLGRRGGKVQGFDPRIVALMDATGFPLLDAATPASCDILLAHHPHVFQTMPDRPVALRPARVVLVLHHPPVDAAGVAQYDLDRVIRNLERVFAVPVQLAPISALVRAQLLRLGQDPARMLAHDLWNVIDMVEYPPRDRPPPRAQAVIGRHSRADPMKWPADPEAIRAAWPDDPGLEVQILGAAPLPGGMARPANWTVLPFREEGVDDFLSRLDFYVYFHHPDWVEAFGIAVAEALAKGLVCILPPSFKPLFGAGAVYAEPAEVRGILAQFMARPDEYARQSRAARAMIDERYSIEAGKGRLQRLWSDLGLELPRDLALRTEAEERPGAVPPAPLPALVAAPPPCRVLLVCGNGIGLGHVTRLMAIARRLPAWVEPVFLTLSLGTEILRAQGFSAEYVATHMKQGVTGAGWNEAFALELRALLDATGARMVVFDGNDAFPAIRALIPHRRDVAWVWLRRALWQEHHQINPATLPLFDMIIEPAELAGDEDRGPTRQEGRVERVGTILLHDPGDCLPRAEAAARLGLDPARKAVLLQLGSSRNFDMAPLRRAALAALRGMPEVQVLEIANPLASPPEPAPDDPPRRAVFPLAPLGRAMDLLITAPGYNSFHEAVFGAVPALFVPNQDGIMDDQPLRAAYAASTGLGLALTVAGGARVGGLIRQGLTPEFAQSVAARAARLPPPRGAEETARLLVELLLSVRTDRPLATGQARL